MALEELETIMEKPTTWKSREMKTTKRSTTMMKFCLQAEVTKEVKKEDSEDGDDDEEEC